jgi:hypothetical protein
MKQKSVNKMTRPYALRRSLHPQLHPRSRPRHVYLNLVPYLLIQAIFSLGESEIDERLVLSTLPFQCG